MAQPIAFETALKNLPPGVHPILSEVQRKFLLSNEHIYHSAYCCLTYLRQAKQDSEWTTWSLKAVFTVTDFRTIVGQFTYGTRDYVTYAVGTLDKVSHWVFGSPRTWKWIIPPLESDMPDVRTLGHDNWIRKIAVFHELPLIYQDQIQATEYRVQHKGKTIDLYNLRLSHGKGEDDWYDVAFLNSDGKKVYDLLQEAIRNRGRLSSAQTEHSTSGATPNTLDPVESLAKLKRMAEQGLITDAEYQSKKSEILGRM